MSPVCPSPNPTPLLIHLPTMARFRWMDGWVVDGRKISRRMKLPACSSMPAIFEPMGLYRRPSSSGYPPGVLCYQVFDLSQVCFSPPVLANGSSPATLFLFWRRYLANRAGVAADYSVFIPVRLAWGLIPGGSEAPKKKGAEAVPRHALAVREAMRVICRARGWQVDCKLAWLFVC